MQANGHLPRRSARSAPKPPKERRERRAALEAALLRGEGMDAILASLGPRYGVSARTLRSDRQRIERRTYRGEEQVGLKSYSSAWIWNGEPVSGSYYG